MGWTVADRQSDSLAALSPTVKSVTLNRGVQRHAVEPRFVTEQI
jgi:hypothetical protein